MATLNKFPCAQKRLKTEFAAVLPATDYGVFCHQVRETVRSMENMPRVKMLSANVKFAAATHAAKPGPLLTKTVGGCVYGDQDFGAFAARNTRILDELQAPKPRKDMGGG